MKMVLIAVLAALAFANQTYAAEQGADKKNSRDRLLKMAAERRKSRPPTGGIVIGKAEGATLEIVNNQNVVADDFVRGLAFEMMRTTRLPITVVNEKTNKCGAWLELIESDDDPTIISAIDEGWAKVNMKKLMEGAPDPEKLKLRARKQLWRGLASSLGVGVSAFQPCLMRNIGKMKELDAIATKMPGPATLNSIGEAGEYFGILPVKIASYRKACQEGWAPTPTNDMQRTIWNETHEIPSKPLTIEKK